jgi:hypothetical protein
MQVEINVTYDKFYQYGTVGTKISWRSERCDTNAHFFLEKNGQKLENATIAESTDRVICFPVFFVHFSRERNGHSCHTFLIFKPFEGYCLPV